MNKRYNGFSPICVSVYTRLDKFYKLIQSLQVNDLSEKSILYVLSDGAKQGDEDKVNEVRDFSKTITGFKKVVIIENDINSNMEFKRHHENNILSDYGSIIRLADDIIVGKGFLKFVNKGLEKYKDNKKVFAICGYTPPVYLEEVYDKNVYFLNRFSAWGYGTWSDRVSLLKSEQPAKMLKSILNDKGALMRLSQGGEDVLGMAELNASGQIDAMDVSAMCYLALYNKYIVAPTKSLTNNIGHDGTGVHCGVTDKFDVTIDDSGKDLDLPDYIEENEFVKQKLYAFRSNISDYRSVTRGKVPNSPFFPQQDINLNDQSKIDDRLMFLVSLPRSGSTLTQRVISSHNDVYSLPEPWNMLHVLYALKNGGIESEFEHVTAKEGLHGFLDSIGGDKQFYKAVRCYSDYLYSQAFKNTNKRYYLDKTPRYFHILNELLYIYPNAKYILLLRNPLSILSSVLKTWFDNDVSKLEGTSHLRDLLLGPKLLLECITRYPDKIKVVRYENLVNSPEQSFSELFDYLGLSFDENILNYQESNFKKSNFGDQVNVNDHKKPVNCYVDNWKDYFNEYSSVDFALSYLEDLGSNVINGLGYDFDYLKHSLNSSKNNLDSPLDIDGVFLRLIDDYELDSDNKWTVKRLSEVLKKSGHINEANQVLLEYLNKHPEDIEVIKLLPPKEGNEGGYLVTVIISTYDSEHFIKDCLDDLCAQSIFEMLEIIVIDSCSSQNEGQIVESYKSRYKNIKYIRTDRRETVYAAWNRAIVNSSAPYITNANTDDRHAPFAFERMVKALNENKDISLVYADCGITKIENQTFNVCDKIGDFCWPEFNRELLFSVCYIGPQPMWRRKLHIDYGLFDGQMKSAGDYEFWLRVVGAEKFFHLNENLGLYLLSPDSVQNSNQGLSLSESEEAKKRYWPSDKGSLPESHPGFFVPVTHDEKAEEAPSRQFLNLKERPLISVVLPTLNRNHLLLNALKSLANQTYSNWEAIVVNDGGEAIVRNQIFSDTRIKLIEMSENYGQPHARNIALKAASGEIICFLDDDDVYLENHLEVIVNGIRNAGFVYTLAKYIFRDASGNLLGTEEPYTGIEYSREKLLVENFIPINTWGVRIGVFDEAGYFDEGMSCLEDWELLIRLSSVCDFVHIPVVTANVNSIQGSESVTSSNVKNYFEVFSDVYERHADSCSPSVIKVREQRLKSLLGQSRNSVAVILHLFYTDLWEEYELALAGIQQDFDLYISIHEDEDKTKDISSTILKRFPDANIYKLPNKGRDILPFLTIFKEIQPLGYKLILKLHTKKSAHLKGYQGVDDAGEKWRKTALSSLVQWGKRVDDIFELFESNPSLGIFAPFDRLHVFNSADVNFQTINQLMPDIDVDTFDKKQFMYAGGSMFWFRPEAIEGILKLNFTSDDFEDESGQIDGTKAHAIERLFGVVCKTSGYILTDRMSKRDDIAYQGWLEEKREHDLSRDLLFLSDNSIKPVIHCLVYVESEDLPLLANTIDSMGSQTYELWHLSIISTLPCPEEMFNEVTQLSWLQIDQQFDIQQLLLEIGVQADWIGFIEAGDYLESHALSSCMEYFNKNSEWQVVYTDEDKISPEGFFHSPQFKPDFNLDLLYSTDYLGGLTLFRIEFLGEMGVINYPSPFAAYDVVLHYLEFFGEAVIGHVENILLHRNDNLEQFFLAQLEFKEAALVSHFKRIKSNSLISKGLVEGSFVVKHQFKDEPKVSIIIPTKDQLSLLKACIDSILEKTSYLNYEVIIIDNQSVEVETKNYFDKIQKPGLIRVVEYQKPYNYAAINNFAAKQAMGDYLVLLNNDTMVLQEEWLHGMLSHAQRSDVGIVGVKLVFPNKHIQHAGVVLGMGGNGVAEHPHIGIPMESAGYMSRAMVTQNVSAVTAACLMIKKDIYQQVGGLDEEKFKILYNDVDLCLKVREQGYKIFWTPYVTLIHHGSSSLKKVKQDKKKAGQSQQEVDNMLEKWLPQLANDPAYNRNLSLKTTDFQVDTSMNVTWNVDFKDKPRIYAFPTDSQGVGQYRVRGPLKALTQMGKVEASLANNLDQLVFPTPVEIERIKPDILLIQNGFLDHMLTAWKRYRKFNDVFMVCGQDDVVYMLPDNHPRKGEWPKNIRRKVKEQFQLSDRLIVANEALAEEFKKMADEIVVVPNYLENVRWDALILPENNKGKKLRVGWAGGQEHIGDLKFILPVVEALHKEVDWVFMGLCIEELRPYVKEIHHGVDFDFYPQRLADLNLDLAIAPLMHNKFNECKTNLRLLEYGVLGWPVVCSDVLPYQNAPVTRVANNAQHWIKILRDKINEPEALSIEGAMLQQWVVNNYMLDDHVDKWYAALMP